MFIHIFTYRLKCLLRDRETIFWTMLFPLILATFFSMALSNIGKSEMFEPINIAVADDKLYQNNENLKLVLNEVSKGDDRLFNLTETSKDKAEELLDNDRVDGYIIAGSPIKLVVSKSGFNQNIIKSFIDNYMQTEAAVLSILKEEPAVVQELITDIGNSQKYIKEVSATHAEPNVTLNYFYTLIAMACLYGGFFGMREINDIQADISSTAARVNVAPVHKLKTFLYSAFASFLIQFAEMLVLLAYLMFALKVDFGSRAGYVLLTTFIGSITGLSFGAIISALVKKSEGAKVAILISVSMTCSFLAGMMFHGMKYIIAQKVPALSYLNPISLLTDAFYCLYYYDTFSRYALNIAVLLIFIIVFCSGTYFIIRRRKYASL